MVSFTLTRRGFTLDGGPNYAHGTYGKSIACQDHTGKDFISFSAMCRSWDVTTSMVHRRLQRGFTLEEALCTPRMVSGRPMRDYSRIETRRHHINRVVKMDAPDIRLITRPWV